MKKAIIPGMSVSLLIVIVGALFIIKGNEYVEEAPWLPVVIGILLCILGIYRFVTFYKVWKES